MGFSSQNSMLSQGRGSMFTFNIEVPCQIEQKELWYVASCKKLDIYSQGETEEIALHNLIETLELFLTSCYDRGVLDNVLIDCGFKKVNQGTLEANPSEKKVTVSLPLFAENNSACPA